jgi:hypothetical protein
MIAPMTEPMTVPTKQCVRCEKIKPISLFSKDKRASDGLYSSCKACCAKAAQEKRATDPTASRAAVAKWKQANPEAAARHVREWHERNPESHRATMRRQAAARRARKVEQYWNGDPDQIHCGVCKTTEAGGAGRGFHLDHDHETGETREFLCHHCNVGLGYFRDDPDLLIEAALYLMRHKGTLSTLLPRFESDKEV